MISAFLSHNTVTKETLFKSLTPCITHKQSYLTQAFITMLHRNTKNNFYYHENFFFTHITIQNTTYSLISTRECHKHEMQHILDHLRPLLNENIYNLNFVIDEIFPFSRVPSQVNYILVPIDTLRMILNAESNDEKIYEN
ncbi:hypothetical protein COBT_001706, partial [Conglomerata obtusa]